MALSVDTNRMVRLITLPQVEQISTLHPIARLPHRCPEEGSWACVAPVEGGDPLSQVACIAPQSPVVPCCRFPVRSMAAFPWV